MKFIIEVVILTVVVVEVIPLALRGPKFTRYDPCGLGVVQFDKTMADNVWMGILNFGLYPELEKPEIEIHFKEEFKLAWSLNDTCNMSIADNYEVLSVKPQGKDTKRYIFYIYLASKDSTPFISEFIMNGRTLCTALEKDIETNTIELSSKRKKDSPYVCGRRTMQHTELMTIETDAKDGEWPWHVAIFIIDAKNTSNSWYQCGGSVVSRTAIVTSGHCVSKNGSNTEPNRVVIMAGTANIAKNYAPGLQRFVAKEIVIHPSYTDDLPTADLAVIKVENIEFTEYVRPICLWRPTYTYDKSHLYGEYASIIGFGKTEDGIFPKTLRTSNTMIQSDKTCIRYAPKLYAKLLNEFSFCAGFGPKSASNPRNGDSGGGLTLGIQQKDDRISYFLRGVLSKCGMPDGVTSCDPTFYVVYTDVAPHYTWLSHHAGIRY